MVNVVEQFEPFRTHSLDQLDTPRGMIAHVIGMRALAIKQLHADGHFVFLGDRRNPLEADGAILQTLLVAHTGAIAGETNDIRELVLGDDWRRVLDEFDDFVMILKPIQPAGDPAGHSAHHRASKIMLSQCRKVFHLQQFDRLDPHFPDGWAEFLQWDFVIAPFANRMIDAAFGLWGS